MTTLGGTTYNPFQPINGTVQITVRMETGKYYAYSQKKDLNKKYQTTDQSVLHQLSANSWKQKSGIN